MLFIDCTLFPLKCTFFLLKIANNKDIGGIVMMNYTNPLQALYGYRVYFVGSIEEAQNSMPDMQGNPVFFFNQNSQEVYVKQFNLQTGKADFIKFIRSNIEPRKDEIKELNEKVEELYKLVKPKKAVKDDE